jgi:hypothetical protein
MEVNVSCNDLNFEEFSNNIEKIVKNITFDDIINNFNNRIELKLLKFENEYEDCDTILIKQIIHFENLKSWIFFKLRPKLNKYMINYFKTKINNEMYLINKAKNYEEYEAYLIMNKILGEE